MKRLLPLLLTAPLLAEPGDTVYQKGFLSIEDSQKSIELQDNYSLDLVLSDPDIHEPVAMAWDGNGALYVVEMRTYMQDADAKGEQEATSRISRHEDTTGDGVYDKHSIFIDNLLLPRMVLPLDDRIMVGITNTLDLWTYRDSDGDGVADEKVKIHEGGKRGGNMEHQPSGLIWNLDNSIHITYENKAYRFTDEKLEVQKLPRGGGQWGIGMDDAGRNYYSAAGGERPAFYFQQPIKYGALDLPGQEADGFREVFPIADVPDVQGGPRRVNKRGGLNNFTGCAGQGIYRGDRLPADLKGDLIIPEPVGRLIRRAKVTRQNGKTVLSNAYPGTEFARTRDINFRPLWATTSPDGAMMVIDMHRGIIQQGNWTRPGSYLRGVIDKWDIDKNIRKGRIYRLTHPTFKADKQPRMLDESTAELVAHLAHPNGWWRDTAQKLIILRKDRDTVVPALEKLARTGKTELARLHALWTLEGLSKLTPELAAFALADRSSLVRTNAVRLSEPFLEAGNQALIETLAFSPALVKDIEMAIQTINSIGASGSRDPKLLATIDALLDTHGENETISTIKNLQGSAVAARAEARAQKRQGIAFGKAMENGKVIYQQLCFSCHGPDGKGTPMPGQKGHFLAPSFANNPRLSGSDDTAIRTLLHGLTGKIDGKEYEGLMVSMATNDDKWIADITTYLRNSFGNKSGLTRSASVATLRKKHNSRKEPWTQEELEQLSPPVLANRKAWKLTASNGAKDLNGCVDGDPTSRYTTGTAMMPGMWVQVELPKSSKISAITLDARGSDRDYPRKYEVQTSSDGKKWSKPLAKGKGDTPVTEIAFAATEAKYVRITQTGKHSLHWSIHELNIKGKEL
ncbi:MAG: mono/diheme cytochrome c family protein/glucose/arabinose dehydrogenase [Akkermansiaceae bacterium]|jgi:mono/diheme cytochrome c family protein/glucose/arabinose dehydrogenase